jgi:hypothetical protein
MDIPEKLATMGTQSTRQRQTKQKTQHNMCWTPLYASKHKKHNKDMGPSTNNIIKTWALLQIT